MLLQVSKVNAMGKGVEHSMSPEFKEVMAEIERVVRCV